MRILTVHNRYLIRGGEDVSRESEDALFRARGHVVQEYVEDNTRVSKIGVVRAGVRTVWSHESHQNLISVIRRFQPDVVDVHNFFPLISPSAYYAAGTSGVAVVQTLHNFRLLCPGANFYRDGKVCEDCMGKGFPWPGIAHGCYRGSRLGTGAVAAMITAHRLVGTWRRMVDVYIALTEFARRKFIQGGLPAGRIVVKPNFVTPDPGIGEGGGAYVVFLGRLSAEKGVGTLLGAWERLGQGVPLKIIGDGPLSPAVESAAARDRSIEWLGRLPARDAYDVIGRAAFLVVPSECYETFGRAAVEAFAKGVPVIASNMGAMAEVVDDGRTGLLFEPSNPNDLAAKVRHLWAGRAEADSMRRAARTEFEAKYTAERNYEALMNIYAMAIERAKQRKRC